MSDVIPFPLPEPPVYPAAVLIAGDQSSMDALAALPFGYPDHDHNLAANLAADDLVLITPAHDPRDHATRLRLLRRVLVDQEELGPAGFCIRLLDAALLDLAVAEPEAE